MSGGMESGSMSAMSAPPCLSGSAAPLYERGGITPGAGSSYYMPGLLSMPTANFCPPGSVRKSSKNTPGTKRRENSSGRVSGRASVVQRTGSDKSVVTPSVRIKTLSRLLRSAPPAQKDEPEELTPAPPAEKEISKTACKVFLQSSVEKQRNIDNLLEQ